MECLAHASMVGYINRSLRSELLYKIVHQIVAASPKGQLSFHLLYPEIVTSIHGLEFGLLGDSCYKF